MKLLGYCLIIMGLSVMLGILPLSQANLPLAYQAPEAPAIHKSDPKAQEFGHPMVPGGIHNYAQLVEHEDLYKGFNLGNAKFITLTEDVCGYVSYRKYNATFWTKNIRCVHKGEAVIFDGQFYILQACGNMISTSEHEDQEGLGDDPVDVYPPTPREDTIAQVLDAPDEPSYLSNNIISIANPDIPVVPQPSCSCASWLPPTGFAPIVVVPPPVSVTENAMIVYLIFGLVAIILLYYGTRNIKK